jgi:hypothetical protein
LHIIGKLRFGATTYQKIGGAFFHLRKIIRFEFLKMNFLVLKKLFSKRRYAAIVALTLLNKTGKFH